MDLGFFARLRGYADSSAATGICRRTGIGRVRHLAVGHLWVHERVRPGDFELIKCRVWTTPPICLPRRSTARPSVIICPHLASTGRAGVRRQRHY
eukprot:4256202-Alexandrium_andersonii.AAC.1